MRMWIKKAGAVLCLLAMFIAGGGHWAVLQTIAWGRMIVDYSRTASLATAVEETFDGDHPCPMCTSIKKGRSDEQKSEQTPPLAKPTKAPEPMYLPAIARVAPAAFHRLPHDFERVSRPADLAEPPPTPPPQHLAA